MFASSLAMLLVLSGPVSEIVRLTSDVELKLHVIEAFEHGPVVLDVSITNRGNRTLSLDELTQLKRSLVFVPASWKREARSQPICRILYGISRPIKPGETVTQRHTLHGEYRSTFPAGTHSIEVLWKVSVPQWREVEGRAFPRPGELAAFPAKTFNVTISPATPTNRWALAARLEAEFAALPPPAKGADRLWDTQYKALCDKVILSPHKELIPLAFRLLERYPFDPLQWDYAWFFDRDLVETILQADPPTAHRLFVDRLITSPPGIHPVVVFPAWQSRPRQWGDIGLEDITENLFAVFNPDFLTRPTLWHRWNPIRDFGWLIEWAGDAAGDAAARRLPDAELRRLAEAKDPEVRKLVAETFGSRLRMK
jgi:hypothetical protein